MNTYEDRCVLELANLTVDQSARLTEAALEEAGVAGLFVHADRDGQPTHYLVGQ